jgi:hypothetical protein
MSQLSLEKFSGLRTRNVNKQNNVITKEVAVSCTAALPACVVSKAKNIVYLLQMLSTSFQNNVKKESYEFLLRNVKMLFSCDTVDEKYLSVCSCNLFLNINITIKICPYPKTYAKMDD